jgi:hypothetical protein
MGTRLADPRPESAELQTEGPTPARFWGDQWLRVSEKVVKGLNHQLTNRVASLEALLALLNDDQEPPDLTLIKSLTQEVGRLSDLLQLYRALPAEPFVTTEAVRLQDVIPQIIELHGHHADLRGIPIVIDAAQETPPMLVRPSALLRCLLVLLESCAGNALRSEASGDAAALHLAYGGDDTHVYITFESLAPAGQLLFTSEGSLIQAVRLTLAHAHGSADARVLASAAGERIRYEVRLPTLSEARRIEREALR